MVIVVVVVLLFGSHAGTRQIRDQSHTLEDRNDSNNSLEVHTPNSFIHLLYNSPYMDIVNMHNVMITPSDSVLWEKTMEASYLVGSFPCAHTKLLYSPPLQQSVHGYSEHAQCNDHPK